MRRHDGRDAGRGGRLPGVHLRGDLLPVGQPPPLLLLEIQRAGPQGPHAQGQIGGRTGGRKEGRIRLVFKVARWQNLIPLLGLCRVGGWRRNPALHHGAIKGKEEIIILQLSVAEP